MYILTLQFKFWKSSKNMLNSYKISTKIFTKNFLNVKKSKKNPDFF